MNSSIIQKSSVKKVDPWTGSMVNFFNPRGKDLESKFMPFNQWTSERNQLGHWSYGQIIEQNVKNNFALFDYMGLSKHPRVIQAAVNAIHTYGLSSSSSPSLNGRTLLSKQLENKTCEILEKETCFLYPSGWAACYGAVAGIANKRDTIVIDQLAHNCLSTAANSTTDKILKFKHNNMNHLEVQLQKARSNDSENALLIVLESLYSMNSTSPDLVRVMELAHEYDAIVIIDVAHEMGTVGERGLGVLETINLSDERLIVAGSFSKVFGTNGGFVVGPKSIETQFVLFSPTYAYSSAMSPIQCGIILESLNIAFSPEGDALRERLKMLSLYARKKFTDLGFDVDGDTSAIIPIIIGEEEKIRRMNPKVSNNGVYANMIEFPVVQKGRSLFRMLLSPLKTFEEIDWAVETIRRANEESSC